jgi:inner membrane protein
MSSVLGVFYVFVYFIIQLQDMALLAGSLGLFVIVAILMFLAQKMNLSGQTPGEL